MLKRLLRRVVVLGLGILTIWLIAFVFRFTDNRLPTVLALAITYGVAAYIILPRIVRMSLKILQRQRVPRFTITGDGLPGDPVNLVLTGTLQQLNAAFKLAGWSQADRLGLERKISHHWEESSKDSNAERSKPTKDVAVASRARPTRRRPS
jgi:hypothetical protein